MNTINGKPTGDITAQGASGGGQSGYGKDTVGYGKDTVGMTYEELAALWKKVRPDGRHNNKK